MNCPKCGKKINSHAVFCPHCGTRVLSESDKTKEMKNRAVKVRGQVKYGRLRKQMILKELLRRSLR